MQSTAGPLRIAVIAPPWYDVPPRAYGGIESVIADLVTGLIARGNEVTLIGAGEDRTAARFLPTMDRAPGWNPGDTQTEELHAKAVQEYLHELDVDLMHDHWLTHLVVRRGRTVPALVTLSHPEQRLARCLAALGERSSWVAVSHAQRSQIESENPLVPRATGVIHNAVDVRSFPCRTGKGGYALFLGRINPVKGVHTAIDAARAAGRRIIIAGRVGEPAEDRYFEDAIRPRLGPGVDFVGEADATVKRELLADAECLLFPIEWEEPFGIVMIEAMAAGTPVVALNRGAVREVVRHGITGVVCERPQELPEGIERVADLSPEACRLHTERHFDVRVLAARYERVYRTLTTPSQLLLGSVRLPAPSPRP